MEGPVLSSPDSPVAYVPGESMRWPLPPQSAIGFFVAFAAVLISFITDEAASRRGVEESRKVSLTLEVIDAVDGLALQLSNAESAERGYLITADDQFIEDYHGARETLPAQKKRLRELSRDSPRQLGQLEEVERLIGENLKVFDRAIELRQRDDLPQAAQLVQLRQAARLMDTTLRAIADMRNEALRSLEVQRVERDRATEFASFVRWASSTALAGLIVLAAFNVRRDFLIRERILAERQSLYEDQQRLVGIVGHDLRSPLSAILGAVSMVLRKGTALPEDRQKLERIRNSAQRMDVIIRDLLDYSEAGVGGGLRLERQPGNLAELCRRVVEEIQEAAPDRPIEYRHGGMTEGEWDAGRLQQVLANLLSNAVKYGEPGSAIEVCCQGAEKSVILSVSNRGQPIPPAELEELFRPFRRGRQAARDGQRSLGLGLYIVDRIVRAHDGRIRVTSSSEEGTRFEVRLPRIAPPQPSDESS